MRAFGQSMEKVYDVPAPAVAGGSVERGKHVAESIGGCATSDCHGVDLAGGKSIDMGPLGTLTGPNITPAGKVMAGYTDGELARLMIHGLRRDGRSVRFMPVHELNWLPDEDVASVIAYVRAAAPVEKADGPFELGLLAKVLDRQDAVVIDVARRVPHDRRDTAPAPAPTAAYGAFLAKGCMGCHGATFSGGPIPGAPGHLAVPTNITPHETGIGAYSYEDFTKLLATGVRPDGRKLDPFMPFEALAKMDEVEKQALWAYLRSLPPKAFGGR